MKKIKDLFVIEKYYNDLGMSNLFDKDMKNHMELIKFEVNEYLSREGEELPYFLFLVQGKAKVFKTLPNGKSFLLSLYKPFRVIGDIEIIKNQCATATLQALSSCYCLAIPMDEARHELIQDNKFLKFTCESLAEKLDEVSLSSSVNLLYPLENRLASYINESIACKNNDSADLYIDFDENLVDLAELLGSSYRHLLRTFAALCKKGVLEKDKNGYKVKNKELLVEFAGDIY